MTGTLPTVLIAGLLCTPRLFGGQLNELWRAGPVLIADHTRDDHIAGIARRVLATAPPRFALAGLSLGGMIALEIARQDPGRVARLALLDTTARPEPPDRAAERRRLITLARRGSFGDIPDLLFPSMVHRDRRDDADLRRLWRRMGHDTGPDAFVRQATALMTRPDARPGLGAIGCPTLVLVGDADERTPPDHAAEIADAIPSARLVVVPDCGHLSTLERPEPVTQALLEWLQTAEDTAHGRRRSAHAQGRPAHGQAGS